VATQLLVRLPDDLAKRFKRSVAPRQRSKFIERLLQEALPSPQDSDDDPLYQAALAIEQDEKLAAEMGEWEEATLGDGLSGEPDDSSSR
jgi:metal-responsive CopG/Arc/MetJ family transcriptional regulator